MSILFQDFSTSPDRGIYPYGKLFAYGGRFYGTTQNDAGGHGTIFSINASDGSDYTVELTFSGTNGSGPRSGLAVYLTVLVGTTVSGGAYNGGVLYYLRSRDDQVVLVDFNPSDSNGCNPYGTPLMIGAVIYGTTASCGANSLGTLYQYDLDTLTFSVLHNMAPGDGGNSQSALIHIGRILYGTMNNEGANGTGTIFSFDLDTLVYTVLYNFEGGTVNASGAYPSSELLYHKGRLYGTTVAGGTYGSGVVYSITLDGATFTTLHSFTTNTDGNGAYPYSGLTADDGNKIYGITSQGGQTNDSSVLYSIDTTSSNFQIEFSFFGYGYAYGTMIVQNHVLYGTVTQGGGGNYGAVFYFSLPVTCFKEGSKILTDRGYVRIEDLRPGDLVKTLKHGHVPIHGIAKKEIQHHPSPDHRTKDQLYVCRKDRFPEMAEEEEELVLTGCHSLLVEEFKEHERKQTELVLGRIFVTDGKYRLPACVDKRATVYPVSGLVTVYHLALENDDYYMNYGIYAHGILVETCSRRYLNECSRMTLV